MIALHTKNPLLQTMPGSQQVLIKYLLNESMEREEVKVSRGSPSVRSLEEEEPTETLRRSSFGGQKETRRVWHSRIPVDTVIDQPCQMLPSSGENDLWISRMESLPISPRWVQ